MDQLTRLKNTFTTLDSAFSSFNQFQEVEATDYRRKEMAGLIKKYVSKGLFVRKDEGKAIKLYTLGRYEHNMQPDLEIELTKDNKFTISDCSLIGSIQGVHEAILELGGNV